MADSGIDNVHLTIEIDVGAYFGMPSDHDTATDRSPSAAPLNSARGRSARGRSRSPSVSPEPPLVNGNRPGTRLVRRGAKWTPSVTRSSRRNDSPACGLSPPIVNPIKRIRTSTPLKGIRSSVPIDERNDGPDSSTVGELSRKPEAITPQPGSVESLDKSPASSVLLTEDQVDDNTGPATPSSLSPLFYGCIGSPSAANLPLPGSQVDNTEVYTSPPVLSGSFDEINISIDSLSTINPQAPSDDPTVHRPELGIELEYHFNEPASSNGNGATTSNHPTEPNLDLHMPYATAGPSTSTTAATSPEPDDFDIDEIQIIEELGCDSPEIELIELSSDDDD